MSSIFDRSLIYVVGKGGVGRSTVAGALGLVAAARGRRTIVCEVAEQGRLPGVFDRELAGPEEIELADELYATSIDPQAALEEWLRTQVGGPLVRLLAQSSAFQYFVAAAPGARELVTIVKVWELAQRERWKRGAEGYDLVIVDAPASGHGVGMLRTPKTYGDLARIGPIRKQADQVTRFLRNPRRTAYVGVALAEEMPVTETLEVDGALRDHVGGGLGTIIVNGVYPRRFAKADIERLEAAARNGAPPAVRAVSRASCDGCAARRVTPRSSRCPSCSSRSWVGRSWNGCPASWTASSAGAETPRVSWPIQPATREESEPDGTHRRPRASPHRARP